MQKHTTKTEKAREKDRETREKKERVCGTLALD